MNSSGTQFNKVRLASQYDNIIIGAGMSGLTCAALLAMHGESVLVLESHYTVGGYTHTFKKKGFEFNAGLHFDGQVGYPGHPLNTLFDWISNGRIQWHSPTQILEELKFGPERDSYIVKTGLSSFADSISSRFPGEEKSISKYVELVRKVEDSMTLYFAEKTLPRSAGDALAPFLRGPFLNYSKQITYDVCQSLTKNEKLIAVLNGSWHEFGVPPKLSSFAGHSMYRANTMGGTFFPVGGTAGLAHQIVPTIESHGGTVALSAAVKRVIVENGRAVGVEMASGEIIKGQRVISSIGVKGTFSRLLDEEYLTKLPYRGVVQNMDPTCSASGLFIGLKGTNEELDLPAHPVIDYRAYDHGEAVDEFNRSDLNSLNYPYVYMISQSARDPAWREKHPGKSSLLVCVYDQIIRYSKWQDSNHQNRPQEYLDYKNRMKELLLEKVFEQYPQLRDKVEVVDAFTPLTVKQYGNHPSGEIYGLAQSPLRFEQKWLRPDTSISSLYLTGVDVTTSSIVGAMLSGATTALNILGPLRGRKILNRMLPWKFNRRSPEYYK